MNLWLSVSVSAMRRTYLSVIGIGSNFSYRASLIFLLPDPRIIHSARGYNRHPRITTAHSAQKSTASLGCKVAKLREFVCVDCVRRMLFIQDLQPDNLGIY